MAAVTGVSGENSGCATGKAIVLLSDGTGNSAAKLARTNVWRLYRALDLEQPQRAGVPRQIACYDDGVGTSSFRPLELLGGIFGWGLKRNVLDLYKFLCRHYEPGDRIYAFGFSRGAFTVRVLVGLVCQEGLLRGLGEEELERHAPDAYRELRKCFDQTGGLMSGLRWLRDRVIESKRSRFGPSQYKDMKAAKGADVANIEFVGVWDTVAAYGMPIAELTRGIDKWVWPLSMPDYKLSTKVKMARHALALDDERDTFHPLLWDEVAERQSVEDGLVKEGRLQQVWFAGMHSDVGGGYADDSLAHVSLVWMIEQARKAGLNFDDQAVRDIERASNELGPMHDSRRGVSGYYRYQPRRIGAWLEDRDPDRESRIMQDPGRSRGLLTSVRVHESVVNRIRSGTDSYAPIVLPKHYELACNNGTIVTPDSIGVADSKRSALQERVWDEVWKRRIAYFGTVAASLMLLALPALQLAWPPDACATWLCGHASRIAAGVGMYIPDFVPGPKTPALWTDAWSKQPLWSLILAVVAIAGFLRGTAIQRRVRDRMHEVWTAALKPPAPEAASSAMGQTGDTGIHWLRSNGVYQWGFRALKWWIVPSAFGLGILWAGMTLAIWVLLGPAGAVLEHRIPELTPWHLMGLGAVVTLVLVAAAELCETLRRRDDPPASSSRTDSGHLGAGSQERQIPA